MKYIVLLFLLFGINAYAQLEWEKLNGPMGCITAGLVAKGDTIIVGTGYSKGLIFFSTDSGNNWQEANIKSTSRFGDFVFTEDVVFAVKYYNYNTPYDGIYKSYDLANWTPVYNSSLHFWSIGIDAVKNIYAGTDEGQILYSQDAGNSWTTSIDVEGRNYNFILSEDSTLYVGGAQNILRKNPFSSWDILPVYFLNQFYIPFMDDNNNLYANGASFIFKSTNKGNSWTQLDTNAFFQNGNFVYRMIFNNKMIAGLSDETNFFGTTWGIAVSNDSGLTWNLSNNGLPPKINAVFRLTKSGINTYAGTNAAGIFKSTDFGDSWFPVNNGIYAATTVDITFDKDSNLYTANWGNGIQKSTDRGNSWEVINNGLTNSYLYSIVADTNNNLITGTDQGIFRSTDNGENWVQTANAGSNYAYRLYIDRYNRIYSINYGNGIYRTSNLGYNWTRIDNGFASLYAFGFAIDNSDNIYAGTRGGRIYKSTNDGASWTLLYSSNVYNCVIDRIAISPHGDIFATNTEEGVLRSTDNGANWEILTNGLTSLRVSALGIDSKGNIITATKDDHLFLSTDNGDSWTNFEGNLVLTDVMDILFDKDDKIYLATDESAWRGDGVIPVELISFTASVDNDIVILKWLTATETNNKGFEVQRSEIRDQISDWKKIGFVEGNGTTTEPKDYSFIDKNVSPGVFSYRLKQVDFDGTFKYTKVVEVEFNSSLKFSLEQNYPNPFNPSTIISFSLKTPELVTLKIYDILGREVKTMINEKMDEGHHTFNFNASALASGIYFYKITAGKFIAVKKLLLVR